MIDKIYQKFIDFSYSSQAEIAVIFAMFFQFFLSQKKTWKIFLTITGSTIIISIYINPLIIDILKLKNINAILFLYSMTSLMSMELLGIIIAFSPKGFRKILKKKLEIEDEN